MAKHIETETDVDDSLALYSLFIRITASEYRIDTLATAAQAPQASD